MHRTKPTEATASMYTTTESNQALNMWYRHASASMSGPSDTTHRIGNTQVGAARMIAIHARMTPPLGVAR